MSCPHTSPCDRVDHCVPFGIALVLVQPLLGVILCAVPRPKTRLARELVGYVDRTCVDPDGRSLKFAANHGRGRSGEVIRPRICSEDIFRRPAGFLAFREFSGSSCDSPASLMGWSDETPRPPIFVLRRVGTCNSMLSIGL